MILQFLMHELATRIHRHQDDVIQYLDVVLNILRGRAYMVWAIGSTQVSFPICTSVLRMSGNI